MSVPELFSSWRKLMHPGNSWGLAWYLAYEFCRRYYSSHGIAPFVLEKEGMGYYGILLESVNCQKHHETTQYGRMTIGGDVENWRIGGGTRRLPIMEMCSGNMPTEELVHKAIKYMAIEPLPHVSHNNCRHKRWGASYELCFEIATIVALRDESTGLRIWNHSYHTERLMAELDPQAKMKEHPGIFLFVHQDRRLLLAADGRLLDGSGEDLWKMYMNGQSGSCLAELIEERIGIRKL